MILLPKTKQKYVVDAKGKRVGVIVEIEQYRKMLRDMEELESIRAYDEARASADEAVPFDRATEEIEPSK